jgi:hypothetical protein
MSTTVQLLLGQSLAALGVGGGGWWVKGDLAIVGVMAGVGPVTFCSTTGWPSAPAVPGIKGLARKAGRDIPAGR